MIRLLNFLRSADDFQIIGPGVSGSPQGINDSGPIDRSGSRAQRQVFVTEIVAQVGAENASAEFGRNQIQILLGGPGMAGIKI